MKKLFVLLILLFLLLFPFTVALAQETAPNPTQLAEVLLWLSASGCVLAVNWLVANFLEKQPWWNNLSVLVKYIAPLVLAVLIGLGANQIFNFPDLIAAIQPYWFIVATIVLAYFGSQLGHIMTKARPNGQMKAGTTTRLK